MRGATRLKPIAWAVTGRRHHAAVALMYHRVADDVTDPWDIVVSPANFAEQMEVLRRSYHPVSSDELASDLDAGSPGAGTVVVTFDDGYVDNLVHAKPELDRFEVPALLFVTTGAIGTDEEFWWDDLERMLLQPGELPARIGSTTIGQSWDLGAAAVLTQAEAARHRSWRSGRPAPSRRHEVFLAVWRELYSLPPARRREALDELRSATGTPRLARPEHRPMTVGELALLASDGLCRLGSHTVSHTQLPALPADEQARELADSRAWLGAQLGIDATSLAYPYGRHDAATVSAASRAGYALAFTTEFGIVETRTDRLRIPRAKVPDLGGEAFAHWLRRLVASRSHVTA